MKMAWDEAAPRLFSLLCYPYSVTIHRTNSTFYSFCSFFPFLLITSFASLSHILSFSLFSDLSMLLLSHHILSVSNICDSLSLFFSSHSSANTRRLWQLSLILSPCVDYFWDGLAPSSQSPLSPRSRKPIGLVIGSPPLRIITRR